MAVIATPPWVFLISMLVGPIVGALVLLLVAWLIQRRIIEPNRQLEVDPPRGPGSE